MNFQMDKGCCNLPLRKSCIIVAAYFLIAIVLFLIFEFHFGVGHILFVLLTTLTNVALLYGALRNNHWLVLVWLIIEVLYFINWPIMLLGVIFDFGNWRVTSASSNVFAQIFILLLDLAVNVYCTLIVWAFHKELKNGGTAPRSAAVV